MKTEIELHWATSYMIDRLTETTEKFSNREIALYPYGKLAKETKKVLKQRFETNVKYLVDDNPKEKDVISLEELLKEYNDNTLIIISTQNQRAFRDVITKLFVNKVKMQNILILCNNLLLGYQAVEKICSYDNAKTVLDIGCGEGLQGYIFESFGKDVTGLTMSKTKDYDGKCLQKVIIKDFLKYYPIHKYDVVWACHVLEHVPDELKFIKKMVKVAKKGGVLAITVPAREKQIRLAHVHSFSAGRILRFLLYAGVDTRNVEIKEYGYNLTVIIPEIKYINDNYNMNKMIQSNADYLKEDEILNYLPKEIKIDNEWDNAHSFNGEIEELNWHVVDKKYRL